MSRNHKARARARRAAARNAASRQSLNRTARRTLHYEPLEDRRILAGDLELVRNINLGSGSVAPGELTEVSGQLFFAASDIAHGRELWRTDGTAAGTVLVKDISNDQQRNSHPQQLTNVSGTLYFTTNDGVHGIELWKSDGTEAGTVLVKDIRPAGEFPYSLNRPIELTNAEGVLYFCVNDGTRGYELWRSDGTEVGTRPVRDIWPGQEGSFPYELTNVGGILYFAASTPDGTQLWKSDGTATGTAPVGGIHPAIEVPAPTQLTNVAGQLYFAAAGGLWKTSPSDAYAVHVKDLQTFSNPIAAGDLLFFFSDDGVTGSELWKSDGTEAGTHLVKDIRAGSESSIPREDLMTNVGGALYFIANDGLSGYELWKSDGTDAGTVLVKDLVPGPFLMFENRSESMLADVDGVLFFTARDATPGLELWRTDGTEAGTVQVKDIYPGQNPSTPFQFVNVEGTLYFSAEDEFNGRQLWKSDGTDIGTVRVKDFVPGSTSSSPAQLVNLAGTLIFSANDGVHGRELWKSDGTPSGARLVADSSPGLPGHLTPLGPTSVESEPAPVEVNGVVYYGHRDDINGWQLWRSDGTENGTRLVKQTGWRMDRSSFTNVNGTLFFAASTPSGTQPYGLWKSDGTEAGTVFVQQASFAEYRGDKFFTNVGGTLFFPSSGPGGIELWKSDGTTSGTVRVKDINPTGHSSPRFLTDIGGALYFSANDGVNGWATWKSDGTEAGTTRVANLAGQFFTNVNGMIYFTANDPQTGFELWRTDGTAAGTSRVRDIQKGPGHSFPQNLINVNGTLYFIANDGVAGKAIWKSDGTEAGTIMVKDIQPREFVGYTVPTLLTNAGGTLYFVANDGTTGFELWKTDGSSAGTVPVRLPGNLPLIYPTALEVAGDRLYIVGTRPETGAELFSILLTDPHLAGDYNADQVVDGADFLHWQRQLGQPASPAGSGADGDASGTVDAGDLAVWQSQFPAPTRPQFAPPRRAETAPPLFALRTSDLAGIAQKTATLSATLESFVGRAGRPRRTEYSPAKVAARPASSSVVDAAFSTRSITAAPGPPGSQSQETEDFAAALDVAFSAR